MAILVSISMFLIHKLLDRSLAQLKNNGCRVHDGKAIFVISSALDFFFPEPSEDDKQLDPTTGIIAVHYASLYQPFEDSFEVSSCGFTVVFFFRPPNRTPILNRVFYFLPSSTDSGLLALCCSLLLSRLASTPGSSASDRLHRSHQLE